MGSQHVQHPLHRAAVLVGVGDEQDTVLASLAELAQGALKRGAEVGGVALRRRRQLAHRKLIGGQELPLRAAGEGKHAEPYLRTQQRLGLFQDVRGPVPGLLPDAVGKVDGHHHVQLRILGEDPGVDQGHHQHRHRGHPQPQGKERPAGPANHNAFRQQQHQRQHQQRRPEVEARARTALHRPRRRGRRIRLVRRTDAGLLLAEQVHRELAVSTLALETVETHLFGVGVGAGALPDANRATLSRGTHEHQSLLVHAHVRHKGQPGRHLAGGKFPGRGPEPGEGVAHQQRERHPERQVGPGQVESEHQGLEIAGFQRVDQRPSLGLGQGDAAAVPDQLQRILDVEPVQAHSLGQRVVGTGGNQRRPPRPPGDAQGQALGHGADENEVAAGEGRSRHPIQHHHVVGGHLLGHTVHRDAVDARQGNVGKVPQQAFQERVAGAHVENTRGALVGKGQEGAVVGLQVVVNGQQRGGAAAQGAGDAIDQHLPGERLQGQERPAHHPVRDRDDQGRVHRPLGEVLHHHHGLVLVGLAGHPAELEPQDSDVVHPAPHLHELQVGRRQRQLVDVLEGAVGDHHHPMRPLALEERVRQQNRLLHRRLGVGGGQSLRRLPQPRAIPGEGLHHIRGGAGRDDHHPVVAAQSVDPAQKLVARRVPAGARLPRRLHAGTHVHHHHQVAAAAAHAKERRPRQRDDDRDGGQELQDQRQVPAPEPAQAPPDGPLPQHLLQQEERGDGHPGAARPEAVEQQDERDGSQQEEKGRGKEPQHRRLSWCPASPRPGMKVREHGSGPPAPAPRRRLRRARA